MPTQKTPKNTPGDVNEWKVISSVEGKSVYGHRLNTLASTMDDLIHSGKFNHAQIIEHMVQTAPKNPNAARAKQALKAHIAYLPSHKGIEVKQNAAGIIKGFPIKTVEKTK